MININSQLAALKQPLRSIVGKVESLTGSTITDTFNYNDNLIGFSIERMGLEGKFFGFGICQKAKINLRDKERVINITTANKMRVRLTAVSTSTSTLVPYPLFNVTEVHRDENTNKLTITAYDPLYAAADYAVSELSLAAPYTIADVAAAIATKLGLNGVTQASLAEFTTSYPEGANFDGAESLKEVLDAIAEATQTVYFADRNNNLVFIRLSDSAAPVLTIGKADYFTLDSKTNRTLTSIVSATELGDNVGASLEQDGSTQYVRDNPFWELREDIATLVETALANVGGLTINQFDCSWRGNFLLEPGDKIALVTKDDETVNSFIINDTLTYNGGLSQKTSWSYSEGKTEHSNPSTLGAALKQTYAKVDKANKEIEIVAGETAAIRLTADSVQTSVSKLDNNMTELMAEVNTKMTAEDVSISIQTALDEGIERVTTTTGFTFNEEGLHVSKSNSEITTSITEDGMTVYRENDEVLVADNLGVRAEDLHATTFLIIGNNSRLEDYNGNRTGCFWIGG